MKQGLEMKKILGLCLLLTGTLLATENSTSYGIGLGQLYNGVGVNIALQDTTSMKYLAVGCMDASYGSYSGWDANCGFAVGYVSTSILSSENNKHGLGVHIGITEDSNSVAGSIGLGYTYFVNEISNSGWNFGLTPVVTFRDNDNKDDNEVAVLLNLGYQF